MYTYTGTLTPQKYYEYVNCCTLQLEESSVVLASFSLEPYDFGQCQEVQSVLPSFVVSNLYVWLNSGLGIQQYLQRAEKMSY